MTTVDGRFYVTSAPARCEHCGYHIAAGDEAWESDPNGRTYCTRSCAHRATGHDQHRRRISDEERKLWFPASVKQNGQSTVRVYERV